MLPLILSQMKATLTIADMMFNGLHIDKPELDRYTVEVVNDYVNCKLDLHTLVHPQVEDINSSKQWSEYFFGGTKKVKVKEEAGTFKNGKPKYKVGVKEVKIVARSSWIPDSEKAGSSGRASVDDSALNEIITRHHGDKLVTLIASDLLKYRWVSKQLSTYVQGLSNHLIGDKIHGNLNQTATVTGRLSSSNPNLQNISNNPIKKIFTSRFPGGKLIEVDFKQLEIYGLAILSGDPQLLSDLKMGVDIHDALYRSMYGRGPSEAERKAFKARTFQLIYGAGSKAIAEQAKIDIAEAKNFIEVFYDRYPRVKNWHFESYNWVDEHGTHKIGTSEDLSGVRTCIWRSLTGRKYSFKEYETTFAYAKRKYSFSPTEIKNYPVQGFCTGDIVPMMLGKILIHLRSNYDLNRVKMVNTIHDSILFDVDASCSASFPFEIGRAHV